MNPDNVKKIQAKLVTLAKELAALEAERDEIVEKRRCSGEAVRVFPAIKNVERRIHAAKRLLARHHGDEYDFRQI